MNPKKPPRDPQIEKSSKKWVPEFEVFFDRVPQLILERLGVENGTRN